MTYKNNLMYFHLSKFLFKEQYLIRFSLTEADLLHSLSNRSVSIVGNARSLNKNSFGSKIDKNDIIIRLNRSPISSESSHGMKTTWIATATSLGNELLNQRNPEVILWMTPKIRKLGLNLTNYSSFYLNRKKANNQLKEKINARPSVGLMTIDLIQKSEASKIDIFGFDFFESLSNSGRREAKQVPHDFNSEKKFVKNLINFDKRIKIY